MIKLFKAVKASAAAPAQPQPTAASADLEQFVAGIARRASGLGKESAELNGLVEELAAAGVKQKETFAVLSQEIGAMARANEEIEARTRASAASVAKARTAVEQVGQGVASVTDKLSDVAAAAHDITQVALQTRLVAFNASVEAKRAGEAGRGFGVVAEAVKDLAAKVEHSSKLIMSTVEELEARISALAADIRSDAAGAGSQGFEAAVSEVERSVEAIAAAARQNLQACTGVLGSVDGLSAQVGKTAQALESARTRTEGFLSLSESLIDLAAESGIETEDTPFIKASIDITARIGAMFEDAVREGRIGLEDLFDQNYRPVPGSDPEQFVTRFTDFCDATLQDLLDSVLGWSPKVAFGVICDQRGYIPTHNRKYAKPMSKDKVWNQANCRNRRFFIGRTEMAAIRNERPFLLQTYRRDMGGGQFVVMKNLSVPLFVAGRRWGVFRMGYQF
ncbi:MAG TPA: methyl-accepting chemotaxis protein [Noviherbaspirillum sp.]|nr:methyl-accepting chemotaxis protein [Noviherbaspirillum sp.]